MKTQFSSRKRQRGIGMVEMGIALIVFSAVIFYGFKLYAQFEDGRRAENQASALMMLRNAAEILVLEHYADYQAGMPIVRNDQTLAWGSGLGQALSPTVDQLNRLDLGLSNFAEMPFYKSLADGGYLIEIQRLPAGCEASPNGMDCNISGLACFDQPLRDLRRSDEPVDSFALGHMLSKMSTDGGASVNDVDGSQIYGYGGAWEIANPISGQPPGIVCARFGFGAAGWNNFLRVRDTRDPQFQNNVTIAGGLNIERAHNIGDTCDADEEGMIVRSRLANGAPVLLQCNGTIFDVLNGFLYVNQGDSCSADDQFAMEESTGMALVCSNGTWISQEGRGVKNLLYVGQGGTVPTPSCPIGTTPSAMVAAVSASNIIGGNNPGNNTGSFQATINAAWRVNIFGSDGSIAGTNAQALIVVSCVG